ncbi:hypothetical protein D3C80_2182020 [compost metagenome]
MQFNNPLGDSKPQAGSAIQRINLEEAVPYPGQMRFTDPDPAVPDDYRHFSP